MSTEYPKDTYDLLNYLYFTNLVKNLCYLCKSLQLKLKEYIWRNLSFIMVQGTPFFFFGAIITDVVSQIQTFWTEDDGYFLTHG